MARNTLGKPGRQILLFSPVLLVVTGFFAAIPWLDGQGETFVLTLTAAVAIFVMGYSLFVSHRLQEHLDEVQIAGAGFAGARGWVWGALAANVLLLLPPVTNGLVSLANLLGTGSAETSDRDAVRLALFFGLILMVSLQAIALVIASAIWQRRMGGSEASS